LSAFHRAVGRPGHARYAEPARVGREGNWESGCIGALCGGAVSLYYAGRTS